MHAPMQVTIRDADVSVIQVQGPKSPPLMANVIGDRTLNLTHYWLRRPDFQGHTVTISRTGWSGKFGYEIYLENQGQGHALLDALMQAGRDCGVAPGTVNRARQIEAGILSWGLDMTDCETPFEVGLGRLVKLERTPDVIGRAYLTALKEQPLKRQLVGLRVEAPSCARMKSSGPCAGPTKTPGASPASSTRRSLRRR